MYFLYGIQKPILFEVASNPYPAEVILFWWKYFTPKNQYLEAIVIVKQIEGVTP